MGLDLTTDRYPPITSQTRYPLRHEASMLFCNIKLLVVNEIHYKNYLMSSFEFKLYLLYNEYYEKSYNYKVTTYTYHFCLHKCLHLCVLNKGGNQSTRRTPTCLTWWWHNHLTYQCQVLNMGSSDKRGKRVTPAPV